MDFRDALKNLREELHLTQADLASELNINAATVSRWELGKSFPTRSVITQLVNVAYARSVSNACIANLKQSLTDTAQEKKIRSCGSLFTVEHSSLVQLIDNASFPIYVCDLKTDAILYVNKKAQEMVGQTPASLINSKCYQCIMHRDTPCEYCHKGQLLWDKFTCYDAVRPLDGRLYHVYGKLTRWNGRDAQVRYVSDAQPAIALSEMLAREKLFQQQLEERKHCAADAVASAHFNLTKNTICEVHSRRPSLQRVFSAGSVNAVLRAMGQNTGSEKGRCQFAAIDDCAALIRLYYGGESRITLQHRLKGDRRRYESTLDLFQNPATYAIEAYAVLRDITDKQPIPESGQ